mmetsp:Transcript_40695/g.116017  ORF Transcript_40695/g.116017 Transcript_40695/m.116017 type:complete len:340 (-) Transcript_40695:1818-2837(-)
MDITSLIRSTGLPGLCVVERVIDECIKKDKDTKVLSVKVHQPGRSSNLVAFWEILTNSDVDVNAIAGLPPTLVKAADELVIVGFAGNDPPQHMPGTKDIVHTLRNVLEKVKTGQLPYLYPGVAKTFVAMEDDHGRHVHHILAVARRVIPDSLSETLYKDVEDFVIKPIINNRTCTSTTILCRGAQMLVAIAGRRITVELFGEWDAQYGRMHIHGGLHVARVAGLAARWVALSLVDSGLCRECLIKVTYPPLRPPYSDGGLWDVSVDTRGTAAKGINDEKLLKIVNAEFNFDIGGLNSTFKSGAAGDVVRWEVAKIIPRPQSTPFAWWLRVLELFCGPLG